VQAQLVFDLIMNRARNADAIQVGSSLPPAAIDANNSSAT
jgi:hypothetical protein